MGGLVTLSQQRRAFEHERNIRFIELKRERYAALLREADEWVRLINNQRAVAFTAQRGEADWDGLPQLPETTEIVHVAEEVALLAPRSAGEAARAVAVAVVALGPFNVDTKRLELLRGSIGPYSAAIEQFNASRTLFIESAKTDLESA